MDRRRCDVSDHPAGNTLLFTSAFGGVFFRAADGIWWPDTLEGTLTRRWQALGTCSLAGLENHLRLLEARPGMQTEGVMPEYLFCRANGFVGLLERLQDDGCALPPSPAASTSAPGCWMTSTSL